MKVYKYRSDDKKYLKRDLQTFSKNQFFASNFENLNDVFEANFDEIISQELMEIGKVFNINTSNINETYKKIEKYKEVLGIFSLSKIWNSHPLWSYYANDNKGYCIEYDYEKLKDKSLNEDLSYSIEVNYTNKKPLVAISDIRENIIKKMFATKSSDWIHEKEIRLIFEKSSLKTHHESFITAIYFGCKASEELIELFKKKFKNRDIIFYKLYVDKTKNTFQRKKIWSDKKKLKYDLSEYNYEILKEVNYFETITFYIFLKEYYNSKQLTELTLAIREKYSYKYCNIYFLNDKNFIDIAIKCPLSDEEYLKYADVLVAQFFHTDKIIHVFPYKDSRYREIKKNIINQ